MPSRKEKDLFDVALGRWLHGERVRLGYSTAALFVQVIAEKTGVVIPADTWQRIESGRQPATAKQFAAAYFTVAKNIDFAGEALSYAFMYADGEAGRSIKEQHDDIVFAQLGAFIEGLKETESKREFISLASKWLLQTHEAGLLDSAEAIQKAYARMFAVATPAQELEHYREWCKANAEPEVLTLEDFGETPKR